MRVTLGAGNKLAALSQKVASAGKCLYRAWLRTPRGPVLMVLSVPGGGDRDGHPKIDVALAISRLRELILQYDRWPYQNDHLIKEASELVGEIGKTRDNRAVDVMLETLSFSLKHCKLFLSQQTIDAIAVIGVNTAIPRLKEIFLAREGTIHDPIILSVLYALSVLGDELILEFMNDKYDCCEHVFRDELGHFLRMEPDFSVFEFSSGITVGNLCQAIDLAVCREQGDWLESNADKLIRLNRLLGQRAFFDALIAKVGEAALPPETRGLIGSTLKFRGKQGHELNNIQIRDIKRLNRMLLEAAFPQFCPKKQNREIRIKGINDKLFELLFAGSRAAERILVGGDQWTLFRECEARLKNPARRGCVLALLTRTSHCQEARTEFCDSLLFHVCNDRADSEFKTLVVDIVLDPTADRKDRENALKIVSDSGGAFECRLRELAKRGEVNLLDEIGAAIEAISHMKIGSPEGLKEAWLENTLSSIQLVIRQMEKAVAKSIASGPVENIDTDYELGTAKMAERPDHVNDEYRDLIVTAVEGTSEYPKGAAFAIRVSDLDHDHVSFHCEPYRYAERGYFLVKSHAGDWKNYFDEVREGVKSVSLGSSESGHITFKGCLFYSPIEPRGLIWLREVNEGRRNRDKVFQELLEVIRFLGQEGGLNRQKQCVLRPPLDELLAEKGLHLPQCYTLGQLLDILEGRPVIEPEPKEATLSSAVTREVIIQIPLGLHAREAGILVEIASRFQSRITLQCGERKAPASSIIGLITLGARHRATVTITAQGEDQEEALAAVMKLFELT